MADPSLLHAQQFWSIAKLENVSWLSYNHWMTGPVTFVLHYALEQHDTWGWHGLSQLDWPDRTMGPWTGLDRTNL